MKKEMEVKVYSVEPMFLNEALKVLRQRFALNSTGSNS